MRKLLLIGIVILIILTGESLSTPAWALNAEQFRPAFDNQGYINLLSAKPLDKGTLSLGLHFSYAKSPLEISSAAGRPIDSLVDRQLETTFNAALGVFKRLSMGVSAPYFPMIHLEPIGSSTASNVRSFGDILLAAKLGLWSHLALSPFVTFPLGDTAQYTGDTSYTEGLIGIYDMNFWNNKIALNLGARFRKTESLLNVSVSHEILYGLAFSRPIIKSWNLHIVTEVSGVTPWDGTGWRSNRSPFEGHFALRKYSRNERFALTAGSGIALSPGYGTPNPDA